MRAKFHPEAREEFDEALDYLESQTPGLGEQFQTVIEQSLKRVNENPQTWALIGDDVRKYVIGNLPFRHSLHYRRTVYIDCRRCSYEPSSGLLEAETGLSSQPKIVFPATIVITISLAFDENTSAAWMSLTGCWAMLASETTVISACLPGSSEPI